MSASLPRARARWPIIKRSHKRRRREARHPCPALSHTSYMYILLSAFRVQCKSSNDNSSTLHIKESLIDGGRIPSNPSFGSLKPGTHGANGRNIVELQISSIDGTAMCQLVDLPGLIRGCVPYWFFHRRNVRRNSISLPLIPSFRRPRNHHNLF